MDKAFFDSLDDRKKEFATRNEIADPIAAQIVLTTGRHYFIDKVVETHDAWVHLDGHDLADESTPLSIVVPYHQINNVQFTKHRQRMRAAGFIR